MCLEFIHGRFPIWGGSRWGEISVVFLGWTWTPRLTALLARLLTCVWGNPALRLRRRLAFLGDFLFSVSATVDQSRSEKSSNSKLVNVHWCFLKITVKKKKAEDWMSRPWGGVIGCSMGQTAVEVRTLEAALPLALGHPTPGAWVLGTTPWPLLLEGREICFFFYVLMFSAMCLASETDTLMGGNILIAFGVYIFFSHGPWGFTEKRKPWSG